MDAAHRPDRDSLLATKLYVPRVRPDRLPRPRLLRRLEEASERELTLVSAAAGFGKSSLLAEWARTTERRVTWVSLDPDDSDSTRFWRYLVAAIEKVHPGLRERVQGLLDAPEEPSPEAVVAAVVDALVDHPEAFTLVLDDYQAIDSATIHAGVALLLDRAPPGLRLLVAGRGDPPLPLPLMRARGQLAELHAEDLRFTPEEIVPLLEAWGLRLPEDAVTALAERTEGWATGLQLAALSLRGASDPDRVIAAFSGSHRHVLDYLTQEVLERQPPGVRGFLLETSILDRLSGPLCDAVTSGSDGQRMLEDLERANLFLVALDEERRWYRYHRLFADLLRARLQERGPEQVIELHRRAATWCGEHGLVDDAIRHAQGSGDARWAARIVERHVDEVMGKGEGATLRRWLAALPPEVERSRPGLCLVQAISALNAGRLRAAESWLEDAERALAVADGEPESAALPPQSVLRMIPATIAAVRASLATSRGQPEQARAFVRRARSIQGRRDSGARLSIRWNLALADWMEGRPADAEREMASLVGEGRSSGLPHLALSAGAILGRVQRSQGRLGAALRTYQEGLELGAAAAGQVVPAMGEAHIGMAEVLYERDQLDDARRHVGEGVELCRRLTAAQALATGLATTAWIRHATGDGAGAREAMEEAYRVLPSLDVVSLSNPVPAERARLLLAQGRVAEAAAWIEERGLREIDEPTFAREREYLVLARLRLAQGAPERALGLLHRLRSAAEGQGRAGSAVEALTLEALATAAMGDRAQALAVLVEALALGRPEGYVRVFADEGRPLSALLGGLLAGGRGKGARPGREIPTEYLGRLLRAFGQGPGRGRSATGLIEALTDRELEVLELLAGGSSNQEIADRFVVTLDTVKKHVTHILDKLGAANRTQAVAYARELGLIQ